MALDLDREGPLHLLRLLAPPPVEVLVVQGWPPVSRRRPRLGDQHRLPHEAVHHQVVVPDLYFDGLVRVPPVEDGGGVPRRALRVCHHLALHLLALALDDAVRVGFWTEQQLNNI